MLLFPNAKINLGLNITEKRNDGFHNIESVFIPIPLFDAIEITPSKKLELSFSGLEIPGSVEDNLIYKAAKLFPNHNYHIHLHKNIPFGGGLGGGSADASFVLKKLNDFQKNKITSIELEKMALKLGSDCPFFIDNKPKYVTGRGELFEKVNVQLNNFGLVIILPNFGISTKEAYAGIRPKETNKSLKMIIENTPVKYWKENIKNDFEKHLFIKYPILQEIKDYLYVKGACYASMSGSGSTMYGIFEKEKLIVLKNIFEKKYGTVITLDSVLI